MKEPLTVQRDLVFGHTDEGVALMADIYLPITQGLRPGLLLIHGACWQKGSNEEAPEKYSSASPLRPVPSCLIRLLGSGG